MLYPNLLKYRSKSKLITAAPCYVSHVQLYQPPKIWNGTFYLSGHKCHWDI